MRSKWKCSYFNYSFLNIKLKKKNIRSTKIPDFYENERIKIHTGKKYEQLIISSGMIGYKFGQFILTKLLGYDIHLRGKKKKIKKKKNLLNVFNFI